MKRALQRTLAQQDIAKAFDYYLRAAGPAVAIDYVHEMDACMQRIERFPEAGSTRYASLLDIDGLRFAVVTRFPYLVFYLERTDYVDIVRVLHQHRDIPDAFDEQAPRE
jgi:toxin ParE1/3/4